MLTKIVDFEFRLNGMPIDRSPEGNDGVATDTLFVKDGVQQDSGVVLFDGVHSRIFIPHRPSWDHLGAVKIEAVVRLNDLGRRQNVIEIERSLALFVRGDGVVTFTFYAPDVPGGPDGPGAKAVDDFTLRPLPNGSMDPFDTLSVTPTDEVKEPPFVWHGVNTDAAFAPNGERRTITFGDYMSIVAVHDGLSSMRIYLNGDLAGARFDVRYPVLPLVPPGIVAVGAWPHDNRYTLSGGIDRIQVWRHDPRFLYWAFFSRPMTPKARQCWQALFFRLSAMLHDEAHGPALMELATSFSEAEIAFYRALAAQGETPLRKYDEFGRRYLDLWRQGSGISGEMVRSFFQEFDGWLTGTLSEAYDNYRLRLVTALIKARRLDLCGLGREVLECDEWLCELIEPGRNAVFDLLCPQPAARPPKYAPDARPSDCGKDDGTKAESAQGVDAGPYGQKQE